MAQISRIVRFYLFDVSTSIHYYSEWSVDWNLLEIEKLFMCPPFDLVEHDLYSWINQPSCVVKIAGKRHMGTMRS